jgi:hypothetical protein
MIATDLEHATQQVNLSLPLRKAFEFLTCIRMVPLV